MHQAAQYFVGTHDFACVRSVGTETKTTVRTVHYFEITREETSSPAGFVQTDFSTTWCGPWWGPAFTPPRESSPPTSPPCWKGETAPMPAPLPPSGAVHDQPLVSHRRASLMNPEERPPFVALLEVLYE